MATIKSNVAELQTGVGLGKLLPTSLGGRVRYIHGVITPSSAAAAGTVLELARLPKGARLLPCSQLHFEAGQNASLTVKVGDSADDDRYFAAAAPGASATSIDLAANALGEYIFDKEDAVIVTTGAQALTSGKKIGFDLYYVID